MQDSLQKDDQKLMTEELEEDLDFIKDLNRQTIMFKSTSQIVMELQDASLISTSEPTLLTPKLKPTFRRKISKKTINILCSLQNLKNKQSILRYFEEKILQSHKLEQITRETLLDLPQTIAEVEIFQELKLSKFEQLDDFDIVKDFQSGVQAPNSSTELIPLDLDMVNLFQFYLKNMHKMKETLPSDNYPIRKYNKVVHQFRENVLENNNDSQRMEIAPMSQNLLIDSQTSLSQYDKSILGSKASSDETIVEGMNRKSVFLKDEVTVEEKCTPYLQLVDREAIQTSNMELLESLDLWKKVIKDIRSNPILLSDIVAQTMMKGCLGGSYDAKHKTMLVNLSLSFLDPVHQEDRLTYRECTPFLKFWLQFTQDYIPPNSFQQNEIGFFQIRNRALLKTVQCLFEGLTKRFPAFSLLKYIYTGVLRETNIAQIAKELDDLHMGNDIFSQNYQKKWDQKRHKFFSQPEEQIEQTEVRQKEEGFFKTLWNKIKSNDKDKAKAKDSKNTAVKLTSNQRVERDISKQFESLALVYGGESDILETVTTVPPSPKQAPIIESEQSIFYSERVELLQQEEKVNRFQWAADDYTGTSGYKATQNQRVILTIEETRALLEKQRQNRRMDARGPQELAYHIKKVVSEVFKLFLHQVKKTPIVIRAFLKILLLARRNDFQGLAVPLQLDLDEVKILADLMVTGFLATGFRNPRAFGLPPAKDRDYTLEFVFFRACRITFEHLMSMQTMKDCFVAGIDVEQLNEFITEESGTRVRAYWQTLVDVDLSALLSPTKPKLLVDSTVVKIDDLELLLYYSLQACQDNLKKKEWRQQKHSIDNLLELIKQIQMDNLCPQIEQDQQITPKSLPNFCLSKYFNFMVEQNFSYFFQKDFREHEYYLLFLYKKSENQFYQERMSWQCEIQLECETKSQDFIQMHFNHLVLEQSENDFNDVYSQRISRRELMINTKQDVCSLLDLLQDPQGPNPGPANEDNQNGDTFPAPKSKYLEKKEIFSSLNQIFQFLTAVFERNELKFENLIQHRELDLIQAISEIQRLNKKDFCSSSKFQFILKQLKKLLQKLKLENRIDLQQLLIKHFEKIIDLWTVEFKNYFEKLCLEIDQLATDISKFELSIIAQKQFCSKAETNNQVAKIVARTYPDLCILDAEKMPNNTTIEEHRGLLLNLNCLKHSYNQSVSVFMLFGETKKKKEATEEQKEDVKVVVMTQDQKDLKDARAKRQQAFEKFYQQETKVCYCLQKNKVFEKTTTDTQIQKVTKMTQILTDPYKYNLRSMVRCTDEKYDYMIYLYKKQIEEKLEAQKFNSSQETQIQQLIMMEPLDFMGIQRVYTMFLQSVSVKASNSMTYNFGNEPDEQTNYYKRHYDFLQYDLQAKAVRYYLHDFLVKRLYFCLFQSGQPTKLDDLVQQLVLKKQDDPKWVLTSDRSHAVLARGEKPSDFTEHPEWSNPKLYEKSIQELTRLNQAETPHLKAMIIHNAITEAIQSIQISNPYKYETKFGEDDRRRVIRYLLLESTKLVARMKPGHARLHSNLIFAMLFNISQNELIHRECQKESVQRYKFESGVQDFQNCQLENYPELGFWEQQNLYLQKIPVRYKLYEFYEEVRDLLMMHIRTEGTWPENRTTKPSEQEVNQARKHLTNNPFIKGVKEPRVNQSVALQSQLTLSIATNSLTTSIDTPTVRHN